MSEDHKSSLERHLAWHSTCRPQSKCEKTQNCQQEIYLYGPAAQRRFRAKIRKLFKDFPCSDLRSEQMLFLTNRIQGSRHWQYYCFIARWMLCIIHSQIVADKSQTVLCFDQIESRKFNETANFINICFAVWIRLAVFSIRFARWIFTVDLVDY